MSARVPTVLIVDCYDSFTFNLYQQVGKLGAKPVVYTCDTPLEKLEKIPCDRIILSPGPGTPEDSGVCMDVLRTMSKTVPTLGVCLGHQAICTAFGGRVVRSGHLMHGKTSGIRHNGTGVFAGLPSPFTATRYHSLVADKATLPPELCVVAESVDDGFVMGVRHTRYPIEGVQFHPESILSHDGDALMRNFLFGTRAVGA
jgi:anthranilate synthase component 2